MKIALTLLLVVILLVLSHAQETGEFRVLPLKPTSAASAHSAPIKVFTASEWEELTRTDEVKRFVEKVNAAATSKAYWKEDFRRAFYDSFHEQYAKYSVEKYNNGEPFSIKVGK